MFQRKFHDRYSQVAPWFLPLVWNGVRRVEARIKLFILGRVKVKRLPVFLLLTQILLLSGCLSQQQLPSVFKKTAGQDNEVFQSRDKKEIEPEIVYRSFDPDTLYDLLLGELSGQNYQYDAALTYYKRQAVKTRDIGIIQRTWQIANFVGARETANEMADLWYEIAPESIMAMHALSLEKMLAGRLVEAAELMVKILNRGGKPSFELLANYAENALPGDRDHLLKLFRKTLVRHKDNSQLLFARAILLYQELRLKEALKACDETLAKDLAKGYGHSRVLLVKAKILNELGRTEEARQVLAEGLKLYPAAIKIRINYVRILTILGEMAEARLNMELLFLQAGDDPDVLMMISMLAMEYDMFADARKYLMKMREVENYKNPANYHLGRLSAIEDNWVDARKYFMSVGAGRYFLSAQILSAQTLIHHDKWEDSSRDLLLARKKHPQYARQLYLMESEVLMERENYTEANNLLNEAIGHFSMDTGLLYARAMLAEKLDNFSGLEKDLRKILAIDNGNVAALNALGFTLSSRNERLDEAKKLITRALKIRPSDPAVMDSMGWVEYRLKNYEMALGYLYRAYGISKDSEIAAHLGEVLWVTGRQADAWDIWSEALEVQPDNHILNKTLERFQVRRVELPAEAEAESEEEL